MLKLWFLIISCSYVLAQDAAVVKEKMDVFRLPDNTEPTAYRLTITPTIDPDTNNFTFYGEVVINILAKTTTDELTLNSDGLNILKIEVTDTADTTTKVKVKDHNLVLKNQQLKIKIDKPGLIANRNYDVKISFNGKLRDDMTGFYKTSYVDHESKTTK